MNTINIPTALIFFARPDLLEVTFAEIRKAKPNKLFLIQDGPRVANQTDLINIEKCREIVGTIDWDCEVYKNYSEENLGCGLRVYSGLSWAFQHVDRLLILEDDCVPSQSLFPFVEELLERYSTEQRVGIISGMNNLGTYEKSDTDYFFSSFGSIWGWATWKRVWDQVDYEMNFMENKYAKEIIFSFDKEFEKMANDLYLKIEKGERLSSWSFQLGVCLILNNQLNIVPKYNMISNIGLSENGANSVSSLKFVPRRLRKLYFMENFIYDFPLRHPEFIANDQEYKKKIFRLMGHGHSFIKTIMQIESIFYRLLDGNFKSLFDKLKKVLK
ncbi:hypothetical protein [Flavobacterium sp. W20_MBD1_R3]|uniref:hypothetical protein n=1 Tax=Flavobacterium sp. W20_MBD1_R3 TaxID=3240278 RepID=UPI003F93D30C